MTRILAIDHGSRLCGWAVADDGAIQEFGLIRMETVYPRTLVELSRRVRSLLRDHEPDVVALERPMSLRGGHVAQVLIEHYAVCKLAALQAGISTQEVAPPTIKLIVAGAGNADKQTVAESLCIKYGLDLEDLCPAERYKAGARKGEVKTRAWDASDACALAVAAVEMLRRELTANNAANG